MNTQGEAYYEIPEAMWDELSRLHNWNVGDEVKIEAQPGRLTIRNTSTPKFEK